MTEKHTPGPWTWGEDHPQNACVSIYAPADWGDYGIAALYSAPSDDAKQDADGVWGDHPERRANARLMAAAPDLLAAAETALNFIANTEGELGVQLDSGNALRAAIAKARGQQ